MYASTKQGFIACAEKEFGIEVAKRVSCLLSPFVFRPKVQMGTEEEKTFVIVETNDVV